MKEIIKRATNVKEIFFEFNPSMQTIEMLPKSLEHHPYLQLKSGEQYSGKFKRLKSLRLKDNGFDFFFIINL